MSTLRRLDGLPVFAERAAEPVSLLDWLQDESIPWSDVRPEPAARRAAPSNVVSRKRKVSVVTFTTTTQIRKVITTTVRRKARPVVRTTLI